MNVAHSRRSQARRAWALISSILRTTVLWANEGNRTMRPSGATPTTNASVLTGDASVMRSSTESRSRRHVSVERMPIASAPPTTRTMASNRAGLASATTARAARMSTSRAAWR
jgi:hypothetical protein